MRRGPHEGPRRLFLGPSGGRGATACLWGLLGGPQCFSIGNRRAQQKGTTDELEREKKLICWSKGGCAIREYCRGVARSGCLIFFSAGHTDRKTGPPCSTGESKGTQRDSKGFKGNPPVLGGPMEMYARNGARPEDFEGFWEVFEKSCRGHFGLSKEGQTSLL